MRRRQRGQVALPTTGRPGVSAVQAPHFAHRPASVPGRMGTAQPQAAQSTSGASTKRTAWPQPGQRPRFPLTFTGPPQLGQGVVAAGTRRDPSVVP